MPRPTAWEPLRPTTWQKFRRDPTGFLASWAHDRRPQVASGVPQNTSNLITVVCISDTHLTQPQVPDGDVLLHAGDLTNEGTFEELQSQLDWLASLPHTHKVVIAGNHDKLLDPEYTAKFPRRISTAGRKGRVDLNWYDITYLSNSSAIIEFANQRKLTIFGSPWTRQYGAFAFQYPPTQNIWTGIVPEGTDVLLTHGPPKGFLDLEGKGCPNLTREIARTQPQLVVFGHIHAGRGRVETTWREIEKSYHMVMAGDGGSVMVLKMFFWLSICWIKELLYFMIGNKNTQRGKRTTMVNASVVGGWKNDKSYRATVVYL